MFCLMSAPRQGKSYGHCLDYLAKSMPQFFDAEFFSNLDSMSESRREMNEILPGFADRLDAAGMCLMLSKQEGRRRVAELMKRSPEKVRAEAAPSTPARPAIDLDAIVRDAVAKANADLREQTATQTPDAPYIQEWLANPHLGQRMTLEEYIASRRIDDGLDVLKSPQAAKPAAQAQTPAMATTIAPAASPSFVGGLGCLATENPLLPRGGRTPGAFEVGSEMFLSR